MTNYEIRTLKNGLRIVCAPMRERRSVAIGVWVHVGGRDEEPRVAGVSHFLEHLVFKGTKTRSANQLKESVEGVGGSLNAFTSEECTCFLAKAASKHFDQVFDVLSDMVLHATLKDEDIDKERTVIMEEIKMTQDHPAQLVEEVLAEILWPNHALGRPLTGTLETVGGLKRPDIAGYRDAYYHPSLITVVAAGDVTIDHLEKAAVERYSHATNAISKGKQLYQAAPRKTALRFHGRNTEQTHVSLGVHSFGKEHPDEFALDVISVILGGNMSSRLFNEVREERGLAYDIGCSTRKYEETGAFVVSAGIDNQKSSEAIEVILRELEKLCDEVPGEGELRRAKDFFTGQLDLSLENTMNNMLWAGDSMVSLGRVRTPKEVMQGVEKVTAHDVRRVAADLFRTDALTLAVVGPGDGTKEDDFRGRLAFRNR